MALSKLYSRINWRNYPSEESPINEANLNRMDAAINNIDNRVLEQETLKLDKQSAYGLVQDWTMDETTGIITITKLSGEQILFDLNIEKIPVGFELSADGILTMTTSDGTKMTANIGDMIPVLTFRDSDTIAVTVKGTGKNKTYSFAIKAGSVTGEMLEPNYLANVQTAAGQAQGAAEEAVLSAAATKTSATSAAASAGTAADSAVAAEQSASAAAVSESNALSCKNAAQTAAETAANAKDISVTKAAEANTYAQTAGQQAAEAAVSQSNAATSARIAESNAQTAIDKAVLAKSYAVGGTGTRPGEDTDNAMYYMQQAMQQTGGIPTKLSQLENDTGFITIAVSNLINYYTTNMVYTKTEVDAKLSAIPKFAIVAVDTLPTKDISETTIYLLREQTAGTSSTNKCSEWVYINGVWEMLGDLDIDLSGYLVKTGDGSSLVEIFSQASELANIVTGEKHSIIFGKIAKAIATLITHIKTSATATVLGHVKVDAALSSSSTNPVQNKAVNTALTGKLSATGDASDTTVAFTEATAMAELVTGEKQSTLFGKLKLTVKNVISIMQLLGTTDISAIGDGTVSGAMNAVNDKLFIKFCNDTDVNTVLETQFQSMGAKSQQPIWVRSNIKNMVGVMYRYDNTGSALLSYQNETTTHTYMRNADGTWTGETLATQAQITDMYRVQDCSPTSAMSFEAYGVNAVYIDAPVANGFTPVMATVISTNHSLVFCHSIQQISTNRFYLALRSTKGDVIPSVVPVIRVLYIRTSIT